MPQVNPLVFAKQRSDDWLPEIPTERSGGASYRRLHRMLDNLERRMRHIQSNIQTGSPSVVEIGEESGADLDWQFYQFKDQVTDMRERLAEMQLGFKNNLYKVKIGQSFTFRKIAMINREDYKDKMFQQEGLRELREIFDLSDNAFDKFATEYVDYYISTQILLKMAEGFMDQRLDRVRLDFTSLVQGQGEEFVQLMVTIYISLCTSLNLHLRPREEKDPFLEIEGYNAYELLKGEQGIHLIYSGGIVPVPVRLQISKEDQSSSGELNHEVIRIYQLQTFSDLRSGFSGTFPMTGAEFKLLLYAGGEWR